MRTSLILFVVGLSLVSHANEYETKLLGRTVSVESSEKDKVKAIDEFLKGSTSDLVGLFDPDCIYRDKDKTCGLKPESPDALKIEELMSNSLKETKNAYSLLDSKRKRDYSELAPLQLLNQLRDKVGKGWLARSSGDILLARQTVLKGPLYISNPLFDPMAFAEIIMESGWVVSASSPALGAKAYVRGKKDFVEPDFLRIVLFAKPEFDGVKLKVWARSLIYGGQKALKGLLKKKPYKGQWGFLYFTKDFKPFCSKNVRCSFEDSEERTITVSW